MFCKYFSKVIVLFLSSKLSSEFFVPFLCHREAIINYKGHPLSDLRTLMSLCKFCQLSSSASKVNHVYLNV